MEGLNFDLRQQSVRELNQYLHSDAGKASRGTIEVHHPDGAHSIAAGLNAPVKVVVHGHAGYYAAGMNMHADITIEGSAGTGVAENMMSGRVHVKGFASNSAGASAHGGLLVIEGNAALRCGISLKGGNIVVGGSVGSFSAFMAQAGSNPQEVILKLGKKIQAIRFNDLTHPVKGFAGPNERNYRLEIPGKGNALSYPEILEALNKAKFKGIGILGNASPDDKSNPLQSVQAGKEWLMKAGFFF
jgi:hypothetical protein